MRLLVLFFSRLNDSMNAVINEEVNMVEKLKPPYVRKYSSRDNIQIWLVDGEYVRKNIDEEFTNFGQHYRFSYIPMDEFWIDQEAHDQEY
jgi:hypothetical protein